MHTVSFQIFRSLSFKSFFLSKIVLENFFVKSQHSVLKLCHLPFFFLTKKLKKILKKKKNRKITTFTATSDASAVSDIAHKKLVISARRKYIAFLTDICISFEGQNLHVFIPCYEMKSASLHTSEYLLFA